MEQCLGLRWIECILNPGILTLIFCPALLLYLYFFTSFIIILVFFDLLYSHQCFFHYLVLHQPLVWVISDLGSGFILS